MTFCGNSGLADDELNRPCISALSMLNYGHIGIEVKLRPDQEPFYIVDTTSLHSATRVLVVKEHEQEATRGSRWFPDFREWWSDWWNVGKWASWIFVRAVEQATPIWNHCKLVSPSLSTKHSALILSCSPRFLLRPPQSYQSRWQRRSREELGYQGGCQQALEGNRLRRVGDRA